MVGNCITQWASVENALFDICLACLGCSRERAAIVYYRTPTVESRLQLADELVRSVLPMREPPSGGHDHPDLVFWDRAAKKLRDILHTRNQLAHHPIASRFEVDLSGPGHPKSYSWFEVYVGQNEKLRERSANLQPLLIEDLRAHLILTTGVKDTLERFRDEKLSAHVQASAAQNPQPIPR
jgi:hypothetical protein